MENVHSPVDVEGREEIPERRFFLARWQQVITAAVPFGMEIALLLLAPSGRHRSSALENIMLAAVPWVTLLPSAALCLKYKKRGFWHYPTVPEALSLLFALLLFAFGLFAWLKAVNGRTLGNTDTGYPAFFAMMLLFFSWVDRDDDP